MWLAIAALALLSGCISVVSLIICSKKLDQADIKRSLETSSEELSKNYERRLKLIEAEWDNMYTKFASLAGRMDRRKALDAKKEESETAQPAPALTRSDLLKRRRAL